MKRKTVTVDRLVEGMRLCGRTTLGDIADGLNCLGIAADAKGAQWSPVSLLRVMSGRETMPEKGLH